MGEPEGPRQLRLEVNEQGAFEPRVPGPTAKEQIGELRERGYSYTDIARSLNQRRVPTPSGRGQWWRDSVQRHYDAHSAEKWKMSVRRYRQTHQRRD